MHSRYKVFADSLFLKLLSSALLLTLDFNAGFAQPQTDVECLATVIMSEASIGTQEERVAIAWVIFNRVSSPLFPNTICGVALDRGQFATNQNPTTEILNLATSLINHPSLDPVGGATHFFSPISMPKEGDPTDGADAGGGLHTVPGISRRVYFPSWTKTLSWVGDITNIRQAYYMFYSPKFACHLYTSSSSSTPSPFNTGFGVPWNVFNTSEVLLQAWCDPPTRIPSPITATASIGNRLTTTIVYSDVYYWDGTDWKKTTFTCSGTSSPPWCYEGGDVSLPVVPTYYIAYTCQWQDNQWKCGCRDQNCTTNYWQLQKVD